MHDVEELLRLPSPAPFPQSLAFDGETLWMGSRETRKLYALDPRTWRVREEVQAPGIPWGMTVVGDELRVVCGETDEDHRIIRRFVPGHGFKSHDSIYDATAVRYSMYNPTMSATIGGTTYNWTVFDVGSDGLYSLNNKGFDGYQHMLLHDDIVNAYGTDRTGALGEALKAANNPPADLAKTAAANASAAPSFAPASSTQKGRPASPPVGGTQTCRSSTSTQSIFSDDFRHLLKIQQTL